MEGGEMTPESEPFISAAFLIGVIAGFVSCICPMLLVMWTSRKTTKAFGELCDGYVHTIKRLAARIRDLEDKLHNDGEEWKQG